MGDQSVVVCEHSIECEHSHLNGFGQRQDLVRRGGNVFGVKRRRRADSLCGFAASLCGLSLRGLDITQHLSGLLIQGGPSLGGFRESRLIDV